jgi:hypothetical protein
MPAAELAAGASFFVETAEQAQSKPEEVALSLKTHRRVSVRERAARSPRRREGASKRKRIGKGWRDVRLKARPLTLAGPPWDSLAEKGKSKVAVLVLNKWNRQFEFTPLRHRVLLRLQLRER